MQKLVAVLLGLLLVCLPSSVRAQVGGGEVTGIVNDTDGSPTPGATVSAVAVATGARRAVVTTTAGNYAFAGLPPGVYRFEIDLAGFRPVRREGVRIETGTTVRLDITLQLGGVAETVTVTADAPTIRSNASLGHVVSQEQVETLPLNGRSFITLAALVPGVALPPGSQLPRINGGRPRTNEYLFDGISVLQPEPGQVAYFPVIDAIQEFKIETNSPPAEFGRFNGGVVNLTTRSGSNIVRGTAFEFLRHEALNARNYFASPPAPEPEFRRNQFGGVIGGPIVRDRTFFFVDYQGQQQTIDRTVISTVPSALQRQGIFTEAIAGGVPAIFDPATTADNGSGGFIRRPFVNGVIPREQMDPVALALLQRYPLPTSAGTASNYRRTAPEINDQNQWSMRIDQRLGRGDHAFARLTTFRDRFMPVTPLPDGSGVTSGTLGPQQTIAWSLASNFQHVFSASVLNELRVGDTRRRVERTAAQLSGTGLPPLTIPRLPAAALPNVLPTFTIAGYQQLGSSANTATDFHTSVTEIADSATWVKGSHVVKAGFDWRWSRLDVSGGGKYDSCGGRKSDSRQRGLAAG